MGTEQRFGDGLEQDLPGRDPQTTEVEVRPPTRWSTDVLLVGGLVVGWLVLQTWVLPKMGVST